MNNNDITVGILKEIREEIRGTNARLDSTREELREEIRGTNSRLDSIEGRFDRADKRRTDAEVRLSTELIAVAQSVGSVRELIAQRFDLKHQLDDHEKRLSDLEHHQDH